MPAIPPPEEAQAPVEKPSDNTTAAPSQSIPTPLIRLKITDVSSPGIKLFLQSVDPTTVVQDAISIVLKLLNPAPQFSTYPSIRSITLILNSFDGVAYTCSKSLDVLHKEIHFSTHYIESISPPLLTSEITGVLVHEMVHVWQWNGQNTCNGGLIEGIADWVRLKAGYAPPHWARVAEGRKWDSGYEITGWFLDWLEETKGKGTVPALNQKLKADKYVESEFWEAHFGKGYDVNLLWEQYKSWLEAQKDDEGIKEAEGGKKEDEGQKADKIEKAKKSEEKQKSGPEGKEKPKPIQVPKEQKKARDLDDLPVEIHMEDAC